MIFSCSRVAALQRWLDFIDKLLGRLVMAQEEMVNNVQCVTISRKEACQMIMLLTESLGHYQMPNNIPYPPEIRIEDRGVLLKRIVFAVDVNK